MQRCYIQDMDRKVWIVTRAKFPKLADRGRSHHPHRQSLEKMHFFYCEEMSMLATGREWLYQAMFGCLKAY